MDKSKKSGNPSEECRGDYPDNFPVKVRVGDDACVAGIPPHSVDAGGIVELEYLQFQSGKKAMPTDETVQKYIRSAFNHETCVVGVEDLTTNQIIQSIRNGRPKSNLFGKSRAHTKKAVNRNLYAMEKKGVMAKVSASPPRWKRVVKKSSGKKPLPPVHEAFPDDVTERFYVFIDASGYKHENIDRFLRICKREGLTGKRNPVLLTPSRKIVGPWKGNPVIVALVGDGEKETTRHDYKTFFISYVCAHIVAMLLGGKETFPQSPGERIVVLTIFRGLKETTIPTAALQAAFRAACTYPITVQIHFIAEEELDEAMLYLE